MLRLSKLADYSVVILATLAQNPEAQATASQLSERTLLPVPTVAKLLKKLAKSGHVGATRGAAGGYRLIRMPHVLSIASIIEAVDGPVQIVSCASPPAIKPCARRVNCVVQGRWDPINAAIHKALSDVTLADMIAPAPLTCVPDCAT